MTRFSWEAESNAWAKSDDGVAMTVGGLYGIIQFYPSSTSGFFLKGGAGFSSTSRSHFWGLTVEETGVRIDRRTRL